MHTSGCGGGGLWRDRRRRGVHGSWGGKELFLRWRVLRLGGCVRRARFRAPRCRLRLATGCFPPVFGGAVCVRGSGWAAVSHWGWCFGPKVGSHPLPLPRGLRGLGAVTYRGERYWHKKGNFSLYPFSWGHRLRWVTSIGMDFFCNAHIGTHPYNGFELTGCPVSMLTT